MALHVLVVEDDDTIAGPLLEGLARQGFEATRVPTGGAAVAAAATADLVLLDLGLPDIDGKEVCRRIRSVSPVPIIVITARGDELDRVVLLELGADDYVVKPFGFRELVARIGAVTRRAAAPPVPGLTGANGGTVPLAGNGSVDIGPLRIDRAGRRVWVDGAEIALTPKEFDLLAFLAERIGAVRTREDIIDRVWDENWFGPTRTLDVHVAALRRKLGHDVITTVRGVGYRLEVP